MKIIDTLELPLDEVDYIDIRIWDDGDLSIECTDDDEFVSIHPNASQAKQIYDFLKKHYDD